MQDYPYPPGSRLRAYVRDSGHANQELSVPQQISEIRAWCNARGYELPDEFIYSDVAKSSKRGTVGRKAFQALADAYAKGAKEGLLLWDLRRWGRSLASSLYWFLDISQRGVKIHIVSEAIPEGPYGLLIVVFKLIGADEENKAKAKDTIRGQHFMIDEYNGHVGKVPLGYRTIAVQVGTRRDGRPRNANHVEIDPEWGPRISDAFRLRAQGYGLLDIRKRAELPFRLGTLSYILRNPAYLGRYQWHDVVRENYYPPLTDPETFAQAQESSDLRRLQLGPRRSNSPYLLSGLLYCSECGRSLTTTSTPKPSGRVYAYYICPTDPSPDAPACRPPRRYKTEEVDARVMARVQEIITTPQILADLHADQLAQRKAQPEPRTDITGELAQVRREITNITQAVADGMYTRALAKRQKELEDREIELEKKLRTYIARRAAFAPADADTDQLAAVNAEIWQMIDASDLRKRQAFLRALIKQVIIKRVNGFLVGTIHLHELPGLGEMTGVSLPL